MTITPKNIKTQLSPNKWAFNWVSIGATGGIRTPDRSVRSRVLYPAELQLHKLRDYNITFFVICQ